MDRAPLPLFILSRRLWHQLTDALQPLVASPFMRQGQNLVQLYTNFLSKIEAKLNPLKVAQFVVGPNRLAMPYGADEDRRLVQERLERWAKSLDLLEPFERIRQAIEEAKQAVCQQS